MIIRINVSNLKYIRIMGNAMLPNVLYYFHFVMLLLSLFLFFFLFSWRWTICKKNGMLRHCSQFFMQWHLPTVRANNNNWREINGKHANAFAQQNGTHSPIRYLYMNRKVSYFKFITWHTHTSFSLVFVELIITEWE